MNKKQETTSAAPSIDYADDVEIKLDELRELGDKSNGGETYGRVYRLTMPGVEGGRPAAEFIGVVDDVVDEEYIGRRFGGGDYKLRFRFVKKDKTVEKRDVIFHISKTYDKYAKPQEPRQDATVAPQAPAPLASTGMAAGGFLEALKGFNIGEAVASFGMAIKMFRELFPKPQAPDYMRLFEIMASNMNKQTMSDAVVIKAMDMQQQQQRAQSPLSQLKELRELKNFFKEETENQNENSGDDMSFYIKMALEYLQQLLMQNNNNFKAVGAKVRDNPLVTNLIKSDPDLAQEFIQRARELYGVDNARALAAGFGYQMDIKPPEPRSTDLTPETGEEITEENDETQG